MSRSSKRHHHKPNATTSGVPALIVRPSRDERAAREDTERARITATLRAALADLAGISDSPALAESLPAEDRATLAATQDALATLTRLTPDVLSRMPDLAGRLADVAQLAQERSRETTATQRAFVPVIASASDLMIREAPTHSTPVASGQAAGWAGMGISAVRHDAMGVPNADYLRRLATANPWVHAAITTRKQQIGRADIAVLPDDPTAAYDHAIQAAMEDLLDFPNEQKDSYRSLMEPVVDDILCLDRGVITKDLDARGIPHHLYYEDGATIRIFADWNPLARQADGSPAPRYLYVPPGSSAPGAWLAGTNEGIPLTNDQCICIMANAASYRFGLSPVQVLLDTIRGDLAATEKAMALVRDVPPPHLVNIKTSAGSGVAQRTVDTVRNEYERKVAGKREILFLGADDLQVFPLMFSLKDNQFLEWQLYLARKICAVFQISPQQIGITFDINKATAESQQQIFEDSGLVPLLLLLEEYLNREVLADFAPPVRGTGGTRGTGGSANPVKRPDMRRLNLRVVYPEVSELARMRHAERVLATAASGLAGLPLLTPNMALEMLGREPVGGGNTFWTDTKNGPMPWLSYDGETGAYGTFASLGGELGAQDAAGGVDEDERAPDDSTAEHADRSANAGGSTDTIVGNDTTGNGDQPNLSPASDADDAHSAANASAGTGAAPPTKAQRAQRQLSAIRIAAQEQQYRGVSVPAHLLRVCDARKPGRPWSPATDALTRTRAQHVARYGLGPDVDVRAEIDHPISSNPLGIVRILPFPSPAPAPVPVPVPDGRAEDATGKAAAAHHPPRSRGRVPHAVAARHSGGVPAAEAVARTTLAAAVEGVFTAAEARGRQRMGA